MAYGAAGVVVQNRVGVLDSRPVLQEECEHRGGDEGCLCQTLATLRGCTEYVFLPDRNQTASWRVIGTPRVRDGMNRVACLTSGTWTGWQRQPISTPLHAPH